MITDNSPRLPLSVSVVMESAKAYLKKGQELLDEDKFQEALSEFKRALELAPNLPGLHFSIGFIYERQKDYFKAFREYEKELKLNPASANAELGLGRLYAEQGGYEEAFIHFENTLKIDPTNPEAIRNRKLAKRLRDLLPVKSSEIVPSSLDMGNRVSTRKKPTISLCVIAKNEEKCLPRCLGSVKGLVDEIIVLDTGSTDSTVEIAMSFGAKVYYSKWRNDFAFARNEAMKYATKEWILFLDADEWIDEQDKEDFEKLAQVKDIDAYYIKISSIPCANEFTSAVNSVLRFFRNSKGIRYEGAIHEEPIKSLNRLKLKIGFADVFIQHSGYNLPREDSEKKVKRNLRILHHQLKEAPEDYFVHFNLGNTYAAIGKYGLAIKHFKKALNYPSVPLHIRRHAWIGFIRTLIYKKSGKKALKLVEYAIKLFPNECTFHILKAQAYEQQEKYLEATQELEFLLQNMHKFSYSEMVHFELHKGTIQLLLGTIYEKLNQSKKAYECYRKVAVLEPTWAKPYLMLGNFYFNREQWGKADKEYNYAARLEPDNSQIWINLGTAKMKLGKFDDAIHPLKTAIRLDPSNYNSRLNLVYVYKETGRTDDAIHELEKAIGKKDFLSFDLECRSLLLLFKELCKTKTHWLKFIDLLRKLLNQCIPMSRDTIYFELGQAYEQIKDYGKAIESYSDGIKLSPNFVEARASTYPGKGASTYLYKAYYHRGNLFVKMNKLDEAESDFKQALRLETSRPEIYNNLGLVYLWQGKVQSAIQQFKLALMLAPSHTSALKSLALCYQKLGNEELAIKYLRKASLL